MVCSSLSSVTSACDLGLVWVWFPCGGCLLPQSNRWLLDIIQLKPVWRNFRGDQEEIMAIHTEKPLRRLAFVARLSRGSKETLNNVVVAGKTVLISFGKRGIVNGCKDLTLAGELQTVFSCWEQPGLPRQGSVCYLTQSADRASSRLPLPQKNWAAADWGDRTKAEQPAEGNSRAGLFECVCKTSSN